MSTLQLMTVNFKRKISSDAFTPTKQSKKALSLAKSEPQKVCDILGPILTDARRDVIERAISHRTKTLQVAVEGVHDPHNTAAIIRSADAFGIQHIHIIEGATKFKSSAAVTQGSHKWIDLHVYPDTDTFVATMRQQQIRILVAAMDGAISVSDVNTTTPLVLVFGNEAEGISDRLRLAADGAFQIPMFGFVESFNVSVAAGIAISTLRRKGGGDLTPSEKSILKARYYLRSVRAGYDIVKRS
ncbi:MAG: RNA methyltransferase [Deltaproteobacteria bacterium]|nr:RNA methyltransferase [Deltaproteobacteria bacterium]